MTARTLNTGKTGDTIAAEACRYLEVVDVFATLGADPHACVRARAAQARARESITQLDARRRSRAWRR